MFNFLQTLKKKFISFKKSYKLNLFYFKNKKSNFISSMANYSRTNKTKTWTNSLIKLFNFKTNSKTLLVYFLNTIIIVLFIYFKKNAIFTYFTDVLPFELKLNMLTYQFIFSWILEFILNFWWILIFFINNHFINFIIFLDSNILSLSNMSVKSYVFNFGTKNNTEKTHQKKQLKQKWVELSQKSFLCLEKNTDKIKKKTPMSFYRQYLDIRQIKFKHSNFYTINTSLKEFNFFNKINLFLFKSNMFPKSFLTNTISQKNFVTNNKSKNKSTEPILWYLNRNEAIMKLNYSYASILKKINASPQILRNNNSTKTQLTKALNFTFWFSNIKSSKKISNFFSKK